MFFAEIVVIIFGTFYLFATYVLDFSEAFKVGAGIFSVWMVIKVIAAAAIYFAVAKKQPRLPV